MNLLKADLFHFRKDKTTWVLLAAVFLIPPMSCLMYDLSSGGNFSVQNIVFQGLSTDILCAIIGLQLSLFIGKDYANNTIRNKLCYGQNRYKIAACYFLETGLITLLYIVVSVSSSLFFGSILGNFEFTDDFVTRLLCQSAIILAFAVVMAAVVISSKTMKAGFMVTLMVSVVFTAIAHVLPTITTKFPVVEYVCRSLYMVVSTMVISSVNGVYHVGSQFAFDNVYWNALALSAVYIAAAMGITLLAVKRQSYK